MNYSIKETSKCFVKDIDLEEMVPYSLDYILSESITPEQINVKRIIADKFIKDGWSFVKGKGRGYYISNPLEYEFDILFTAQEKGHTVCMSFLKESNDDYSDICYFKRCRNVVEVNQYFENALKIADMFRDYSVAYIPKNKKTVYAHSSSISLNTTEGFEKCVETIELLGYKIKNAYTTVIQKPFDENADKCTIYAFQDYPWCCYEFENTEVSEKYFELLCRPYAELAELSFETEGDTYKKSVYDVKEKQFRYIVIKFGCCVFTGSEFYKDEQTLIDFLSLLNYYK